MVETSISPRHFEEIKNNLVEFYTKHFKHDAKNINDVVILRKSLDARKPSIKYNLRLEVFSDSDFPEEINMPHFKDIDSQKYVHIIGFGPAGMFAALKCLELGIKPIIIERGKDVKGRRRDVAKLNRSGEMNPESNYCFGEGGAGTFSDGKLYTRSVKRGKIKDILEYFVLHGANENILYEAHPHIGTNKLPGIIENLRETILEKGGEIRFDSKLEDFEITNNRITTITVNGTVEKCNQLILATGHSARDIYELMHAKNIALEAKPFAMGFRIEHPQDLVDKIQYHNSPDIEVLPPASYSLVTQVKGKGAFSFCMCPGGIIAPAATDQNEVVVNGWSPSKRDGEFANSGWVTEIGEQEWSKFKQFGPLAGLRFQQSIEKKAFDMGGGQFKVPAQNLLDYLSNTPSKLLNKSSYHPGMTACNLNELYPEDVNFRLREGLREMTKRLKGFNHSKAMVTAPESRTSAPVRIPRTKELNHVEIANLYPCGEGAGFAGGIVSAALDGTRVAKSISAAYI
ncbi:MAG: FAD-binding protein [Bacteroidia bacterium]|nr:FAD-binding protein [Bacteroidia bacterium]